jgi:hypothetical protein
MTQLHCLFKTSAKCKVLLIVFLQLLLAEEVFARYIQADPIGVSRNYSDPVIQMSVKMGIPLNQRNNTSELNHPYTYANNNPITYSDPHGLIPIAFPVLPILGQALIDAIAVGIGTAMMMDSHDKPLPSDSSQDDTGKRCSPEQEKNCEKNLHREEFMCQAIADPRYPGNPRSAINSCQRAAFARYSACLRGLPRSQWPSLTGVTTPI